MEITAQLFAWQDLGYRDFTAKLIPTVEKEKIIGVRTPQLRRYAKDLSGTPQAERFLQQLPHGYLEENHLHGFLIEQLQGETLYAALDAFLPFVDNWASCDQLRPRYFDRHPPAAAQIAAGMDAGMQDNHTYAVRFWIGMAMKYCLGTHPEFDWMLRQVISVQSEEYYINMMIAWYLATAMATRYDAIFALLQTGKLSPWITAKAIQKGCESRRLSPAQKQQLKALKLASR